MKNLALLILPPPPPPQKKCYFTVPMCKKISITENFSNAHVFVLKITRQCFLLECDGKIVSIVQSILYWWKIIIQLNQRQVFTEGHNLCLNFTIRLVHPPCICLWWDLIVKVCRYDWNQSDCLPSSYWNLAVIAPYWKWTCWSMALILKRC